MAKKYRNLTTFEIERLILNGCFAQDWKSIEVAKNGFKADHIRGAVFGGRVKLGANNHQFKNIDGVDRKAGIYNSEIIDCTIGDNTFISNVGTYIANYDIGDNVYIENVGRIVCKGNSYFGNGVKAATVNENGGRAVPIYNRMTAQTAYIMAMYRHRAKLFERMSEMVADYCETIRSDRGKIGTGAKITSCNTLRDVNVGPYAVLNCATILTNGSVNSSQESPTYIGAGVKAHDFICSHGAVVDNGSSLNRCYIGEACTIEYGYMVTDSLFFSNSYCANGEACSIFAGPYTVSHHKSSLLIAGYFLFFNAGSGSNQSNHMFKTGAVHQGIHERGCKFGSSAYIMLPAREGAFTVVLGGHKLHHNTKYFPYSYLLEEEGRSYLLPAMNLRSFGTLRDLEKWQQRDNRGPLRRDIINFEEYNPYIGNKIVEAYKLSEKMLTKHRVDTHSYRGVRIKSVMLRRGMGLYKLAIEALIGNILEKGCQNKVELDCKWIDMAGMFAPKSEIDNLMEKIETGVIFTLKDVCEQLVEINSSYNDHAYAWAITTLGTLIKRKPTETDVQEAIKKGKIAHDTIYKMRKDDASKDTDESMMIGYGIDSSSKQEKELDFYAVRNK